VLKREHPRRNLTYAIPPWHRDERREGGREREREFTAVRCSTDRRSSSPFTIGSPSVGGDRDTRRDRVPPREARWFPSSSPFFLSFPLSRCRYVRTRAAHGNRGELDRAEWRLKLSEGSDEGSITSRLRALDAFPRRESLRGEPILQTPPPRELHLLLPIRSRPPWTIGAEDSQDISARQRRDHFGEGIRVVGQIDG
jgi:hypothetical protein